MIKTKLTTLKLLAASIASVLTVFTSAAEAASDTPVFSMNNTNFVVSIAFLAFISILIYLRVPTKIATLLDSREQSIRDEINSATSILEESKTLLADLEREHKTNIAKAEQIIIDAEAEAKRLLTESKKEIRLSIERKIKLAEEQIKSTENAVIKSIKDRAIDKAFLTAERELAETSKSKLANTFMNESFKSLEAHLKKLG